MDITGLDWGCCALGKSDNDYITCFKCGKSYHHACLAIQNPNDFDSLAWTCPECIMTTKTNRKDHTPVRTNSNVTTRPNKRHAKGSPSAAKPNEQLTSSLIRNIIEDTMAKELNDFMSKFTTSITSLMNNELKLIKDDISEFKVSLNFISDQVDELVRDRKSDSQMIVELKNENSAMKSTINDLQAQVNYLEQQARANNVELQCVPEKSNENLINIISNLSNAVNCNIKADEIANCSRIAKINRNNDRPRSIVIQLASPRVRDRLLAACISFNKSNPNRKLNTSHLGLTGPEKPVFINEHLSPANKALHASARLRAKERGYKFVWIKNGKIFVKKDENSDLRLIKNTGSLEHIK